MYPNEVFYHHKNILRTKSTLLDLIIISWDFRHLIPCVKDRNTYYSILKWKQDREMVYLSNSRGLEILALMDHKQGFGKCPRGEFSSFSSHD